MAVQCAAGFVPSNDFLTQDAYWKAIQNFLRPGDVIVVEDGTSSAGFGRLTLPDDCTYITGAYVWCSIGYATPALLGAEAALREGVHLVAHLLEGAEVETFVRFLVEYKADLLVIGLRYRLFRISRLWSRAYELAHGAPCSVLGVH
jgi:TPP-dependent 2-oxoacid decarboxylase